MCDFVVQSKHFKLTIIGKNSWEVILILITKLAMKLVLFIAPFAVFPENMCNLAEFGQIRKFFGSSNF